MRERWSGPPRMLVLDVDGTLLGPGREITARVRASLTRAHEAGCRVVLATGRAPFEVAILFAETGLPETTAVCSNGAVVAAMPDGEILSSHTFNARPVLRALLRRVPTARVAVEVPDVGYFVTQEFPRDEMLGSQTVCDLETVLAEPVTRVVVRDPNGSAADFHALTKSFRIRGASYAVGFLAWLDLGPRGVSKASTLARVAASAGVDPAEVLAIGDGHNDLEMLAWAGRGVAMGHAPREVQEIADAVTGSFAQDGVAEEVEKWF
ncbi:HAD family hydrolase [Amycolatopsis samaneae]|uniref:HAD family hydrolase n=1 Tax=Amycolatopsis samaneae TaxID=664691 RepID=A0ABW5GEE4_9PSEU